MTTAQEIEEGGVTPGDFASQLVSALTTETAAIAAAAITVEQAADAARPAGLVRTPAAATPNATHNVDGTARVVSPTAGFTAISQVTTVALAYASLGVETVTVTVKATYSDASTGQVTDSKAIAGTNTLTLPALQKDGVIIASVAITAKSTIDSSGAAVTATLTGIQVP